MAVSCCNLLSSSLTFASNAPTRSPGCTGGGRDEGETVAVLEMMVIGTGEGFERGEGKCWVWG